MQTSICEICLKSDSLCETCKEKLETDKISQAEISSYDHKIAHISDVAFTVILCAAKVGNQAILLLEKINWQT